MSYSQSQLAAPLMPAVASTGAQSLVRGTFPATASASGDLPSGDLPSGGLPNGKLSSAMRPVGPCGSPAASQAQTFLSTTYQGNQPSPCQRKVC